MTCWKCKKRPVCFIVRAFEKAKDSVYPYWNPEFEKLYNFVYENCEQFDLMPVDDEGE